MIFPASVVDGDNSIIIVGGRHAIYSGEIVKSKYRWMVHVDGGCWEWIWMVDGGCQCNGRWWVVDGENSIIIVG